MLTFYPHSVGILISQRIVGWQPDLDRSPADSVLVTEAGMPVPRFQKSPVQILFWSEVVLLACSANRKTLLHTYADSHNSHGWITQTQENHRRFPETFSRFTCRLFFDVFAKLKK